MSKEEKARYNEDALKEINELSLRMCQLCEEHNIPHINAVCTSWQVDEHKDGGSDMRVEVNMAISTDASKPTEMPPQMRAALGMLDPDNFINKVLEDVFGIVNSAQELDSQVLH